MFILGANGEPLREVKQSTPSDEELLKARQNDLIYFHGGPFDGKVYSGDRLPVLGHYAHWDDQRAVPGTSDVQMVRHSYRFVLRDRKLAFVFDRTQEGPIARMRNDEVPMISRAERRRRKKR